MLGLYVREKQPHSSAVKHVTGRLIRVSKQADCSSKAARYLISNWSFLAKLCTTLLVIFDGSTNTNTSNSVTFGTVHENLAPRVVRKKKPVTIILCS